jgi:hypothetical protein
MAPGQPNIRQFGRDYCRRLVCVPAFVTLLFPYLINQMQITGREEADRDTSGAFCRASASALLG